MSEPFVISPRRDSSLGARSVLRNSISFLATVSNPQTCEPGDLPRGDGRVVLVIPAFLCGDWATKPLRDFLSRLGYRVETADIRLNLGPTARLVVKLDKSLLRLVALQGSAVDVVGQSLGGVLARDLARRHPECVRRVVTLCSPIRVPITTPLAPAARLLSPLYDAAWLAQRSAIGAALGVPVTALYSEEDGIVDWRECLQDEDPGCVNIRVTGAHATIGSSPAALAAIARALSA